MAITGYNEDAMLKVLVDWSKEGGEGVYEWFDWESDARRNYVQADSEAVLKRFAQAGILVDCRSLFSLAINVKNDNGEQACSYTRCLGLDTFIFKPWLLPAKKDDRKEKTIARLRKQLENEREIARMIGKETPAVRRLQARIAELEA